MEAVDDCHRFRLAYLRKHRDMQLHHGDPLRSTSYGNVTSAPTPRTWGRPSFRATGAHKDRVYDVNIASAAKTTARQRFGGALWRNDHNRDGGGGSRDNFKTTSPGREAVAPRATFAKDATKDSGKGKAKVEAPSAGDKAE
eukprot:jgi/Tetstr1/450019/TSEL_037066.t1